MSVAFLMPTWSAPSELWMRRMLEALRGHLGVIGCYEAPVREWEGVRVIDLGRKGDAGSLAAGEAALEGALVSGEVSVVLAHYIPFALRYEALWGRVGVPVFVHCHGYDVTWDLRREGRAFHPAGYREAVRRLGERAVFVANSQLTAGKLRDVGVPGERIRMKYLGVPVGEAWPARRLGPEGLRCLYLGRLVDFKGPLETLAAFELAGLGGVAGELTFAGDGPLMGALRERVAASAVRDRVKILGAVDGAIGEALRREHDCFVAHSQVGQESGQEEAFGVSFVEAMAEGMPVVSGRGGSLPEIVEEGVSGLLVEPGDVEGQAGSLRRLAGEAGLYERLSRGAWERARERFSAEGERERLLEILGARGR